MHSSCSATWSTASLEGSCPGSSQTEIFPLRGRSKGMALATTSNWIFNFMIGMVALDAFAGIGGYFYLITAGFCFSLLA